MASTSETGHAKNVSNFQSLISFVTGYGKIYDPTKSKLQLANLITKHATAQTDLAIVITHNTTYNNKVNERFTEFSDIKKLATRLINSFETTDALPEKIKDAKSFNRKIQGKRASKITVPIDSNAPVPNTISSSQLSYDQQIQHLAGLNAVLLSESSYTPNETLLKTATIATKINALTTKNNEVGTAYAQISNSRIKRDKTLYAKDDGIVDIALEVKKYVKSLFGATSPEYTQISGIEFTRKKI
ncbi:hypothetical protein [Flavobacterium sp. 140616W15]|uniref:hypothetical protein n=1 Tax=Flavobacterium sp. 140616W15 TaxID=2478552 RepID=UPI000F0CDB49|nr:hypothetical protein [Flavobacterium sp. 140616W15]AYN03814.1 hypothetical protein EAG11_06175 [Flavobacterium sp. 140616W15]